MWIKEEVLENRKSLPSSKADILGASAAKLCKFIFKVLKIHWFIFLELTYFISYTNSVPYFVI